MMMIDHLSKKDIQKFNQLRKSLHQQRETDYIDELDMPKLKMNEKMSKWEIEDLMGTRRDIYKRVRGAVRRK